MKIQNGHVWYNQWQELVWNAAFAIWVNLVQWLVYIVEANSQTLVATTQLDTSLRVFSHYLINHDSVYLIFWIWECTSSIDFPRTCFQLCLIKLCKVYRNLLVYLCWVFPKITYWLDEENQHPGSELMCLGNKLKMVEGNNFPFGTHTVQSASEDRIPRYICCTNIIKYVNYFCAELYWNILRKHKIYLHCPYANIFGQLLMTKSLIHILPLDIAHLLIIYMLNYIELFDQTRNCICIVLFQHTWWVSF